MNFIYTKANIRDIAEELKYPVVLCVTSDGKVSDRIVNNKVEKQDLEDIIQQYSNGSVSWGKYARISDSMFALSCRDVVYGQSKLNTFGSVIATLASFYMGTFGQTLYFSKADLMDLDICWTDIMDSLRAAFNKIQITIYICCDQDDPLLERSNVTDDDLQSMVTIGVYALSEKDIIVVSDNYDQLIVKSKHVGEFEHNKELHIIIPTLFDTPITYIMREDIPFDSILVERQ